VRSRLKSRLRCVWGFRGSVIDYFTHAGMGAEQDLWDGDTPAEAYAYITTLLGEKAVETIGALSRASRSFFLSLHFSAPHWPVGGAGR
jgi:hypothetical protein